MYQRSTIRDIGEWDPTDKNNKFRLNTDYDASEIYNVISNYLFHDIKNIKWILYEIYGDTAATAAITPLRFLDAFNILFEIKNAAKNIPWHMLGSNTQETLRLQWNNFINTYNRNLSYSSLSNNNIEFVMRTFIYFFDKYYRKGIWIY